MIYIFALLLLFSPIFCVNTIMESEQRNTHSTLSPLKVAMQLYQQRETILEETLWCTPNADGSYDIEKVDASPIIMLSTEEMWHPRVMIRKITPSNHRSAIIIEYSLIKPNTSPSEITSNLSIFLNIPYTKSLTHNILFSLCATHASIHQ